MANAKSVKKVAKRSPKSKKVEANPQELPSEVLVYDCVTHEKVIAEYRNEWKWWYGTKLFKVYHPGFKELDGARWMMKIIKVYGPIKGALDPVRVAREAAIEKKIIARMMK